MSSASSHIPESASFARRRTTQAVGRRASRPPGKSGAFLAIGPILFALATAGILAFAWTKRGEGLLRADQGAGYWLGIVGTIIMVVLFTYPLRKRLHSLAFIGRVGTWFRLHMILGIIGPTMIILHSNFNFGPVNSRLALISMLVVVSSGLVGRYLHARVHNGLYGTRAQVNEIAATIEDMAGGIQQILPDTHAVMALFEIDAARMSPASVRRLRRRLRSTLKKADWTDPSTGAPVGKNEGSTAIRYVDAKLRSLAAAMSKAKRLHRYEWLLGTWHLLHIPLLVLLFLTVILHIIAVELY